MPWDSFSASALKWVFFELSIGIALNCAHALMYPELALKGMM
jgi:hypothetical protein